MAYLQNAIIALELLLFLSKHLISFDPLLQKFHNQTKYVVLTSYKCYIGPNFRNLEPNLVGDISVRCNKGTECPIGLICEKNTCTKPGPSSIHLVKGKHKYIINFLKIDHTFDKLVWLAKKSKMFALPQWQYTIQGEKI